MLANRVREYTLTVGTGAVALEGAMAGHVRFSDGFTVGDSVAYVIEDGDNYEIGTGTLSAADTLERTLVSETLLNGVLAKTGATAIPLSGNARIFCALNADYLESPTKNADIIREVTDGAGVTVDGVLIRDGGVTAESFGLGTSSPGQKLSISDGGINVGGTVGYQIGGPGTADTYIGKLANNGTGALALLTDASRDISLGSSSFPSTLWLNGGLGKVGIGDTNPTENLVIKDTLPTLQFKHAAGTHRANIYGDSGSLKLRLNSSNSYGSAIFSIEHYTTERLRIAADGKVGIGTSAPQATLHAVGTSNVALFGHANNTNTLTVGYSGNNYSGLGYNLEFTGTSNSWKYRGTDYASLVDFASGGITIKGTDVLGAAGAPAALDTFVTVKNDGKVGIGTTVPGEMLDISGNVQVGGVLKMAGDQIHRTAGGGVLALSGGSGYAKGANIMLYGEGHATDAYDWKIRHDTADIIWYNDSQAGSGQGVLNVYRDIIMSGNIAANAGTFSALNSQGSVIAQGLLIADGGARLGVQNKVDGGSARGIFLYDTDTTTSGIYLASAGFPKSLNDGMAAAALDGRAGLHTRFRMNNASTTGFLWENSSEQALMSLTADTGDLYLKNFLVLANTNSQIKSNTSDGADTKRIQILGGGDATTDRGAYINVMGNEYAGQEGDIALLAGNSGLSGKGRVRIFTGNSVERASWDTNGDFTQNSNARVAGKLTSDGGAKISVMNQVDGGSGQGIFLWDTSDTNWGMYMSTPGAGKSLADGTACASIDGRTQYQLRYRANNTATAGFLWENSSEQCLMSLAADTGNLYLKGLVASPRFVANGDGVTPSIVLNATARDIGVPDGTSLQIGHWNGTTWTERFAIREDGAVSLTGTLTVPGMFTATGASKISVMNAINGGSGQGIFLWNDIDTKWGFYMAQTGAGRSMNDGTACASLDNRPDHQVRFRVANGSSYGFVWENSNEQCLMSLTADTGDLYTKGRVMVTGSGTATMPAVSTPSHSDSGLYFTGDGSVAVVKSGAEIHRAVDLGLYMLKPNIYRNVANEHLAFAGGSSPATGSTLTLFGQSHANKAYDAEFGGSTGKWFGWDDSAALATLAGDIAVSGSVTAGAGFVGSSSTDVVKFAGGTSVDLGGNLVVYPENHASKAGDIELRSASSVKAQWDESSSHWNFQNYPIYNVKNIFGGDDASVMKVTGSVTNLGAALYLYGGTHPTQAKDIEFKAGSGATVAAWDDSAARWDYQGGALSGVSSVYRKSVAGRLTITGGDSDGSGGGAVFYGQSHTTNPNDTVFRAGVTPWLSWSNSAQRATFAAKVNAAALPTYADDAAAASGGLEEGDLYKTATGELRIKLAA